MVTLAAPRALCNILATALPEAMTIALPVTIALTIAASGSEHPVSVPRLAASLLPSPEPPPPRA